MSSNQHAAPQRHPIRLTAPRWLRRGLAAGLVLALGHGLLWAWLAGRMEAELAGWVAQRRAAGWQVQHGQPGRGGWPWAVRLTLPGVQVQEPGGLGWQGESLALRLALPWPRHLGLMASGAQALLADQASLPFHAASLTGSVPMAGLPLRLHAEALSTEAAGGPLLIRRAALVLPEANAFDLTLEGVMLPGLPPAALALGREVQRVDIQATLLGPLPGSLGGPSGGPLANVGSPPPSALPGPVPGPPPAPQPSPGSPAAQAAAWRDAGGRLELRALDLLWGPVQAGAQGHLALDAGLQPIGRLTLALAGFGEALDALAAAGVLPPNNARSLRAVGLLLQRAPAEGGPPRLQLPLLLRDRTLSAAGFTLLRLAPVVWPAK